MKAAKKGICFRGPATKRGAASLIKTYKCIFFLKILTTVQNFW